MIYTLCSSIDRNALMLNIDNSTTHCIEQQTTSDEELDNFIMPLIEALDATMKKVA